MDDISDPTNDPAENRPGLPLAGTIVYYSYSVEDALATIRVLGPAARSGWAVIRGIENGRIDPECVRQGDIVLLQRDFCTDLEAYEAVLAHAHALHKPVVFDLDDLLLELPADHPDRLRFHFFDRLMPVVQAALEADLITVPTQALKDYFQPYNKSITVIPNTLNDDLWDFRAPLAGPIDPEHVWIGYMGGHSHAPDLQSVLPALVAVCVKYAPRVRFHFWGIEPPVELAPFSQVDWFPPNYQSYREFAAFFQTQTADILIAPLVDNQFNACKSPIKYLEYGAMGLPGVFSRVAPYASIVEPGMDGFLASSTYEWVAALSELIENPGLRREMAARAQEKIKQGWLLSKNGGRLGQVYTDLLQRYEGLDRSLPVFYPLVKSLSHQIQEGIAHKNWRLAELERIFAAQTDELAGLERTNAAQKDELAELGQTNAVLHDQINEYQNTLIAYTERLDESALEHSKLEAELSETQFVVSELRSELSERENEIISYVTSRSWRLTRPFRMLSRLIKRKNHALKMD